MPDATPDKPKMDFSKLEQYSNESEWRMRHLDGIEYGPYSWEQLLQFAKEGRVSISSELQNAISTKGKWVRTERVKAIAALLALNRPPAPSVTAPPASPQFDAMSQALELIPPAIQPISRAITSIGCAIGSISHTLELNSRAIRFMA